MFWSILGEVKSADGMVRSLTDIPVDQKANYSKLFHSLLSQGVYLAPSGFEVSFMSTAHSDEQLDRVVHAIEKAKY